MAADRLKAIGAAAGDEPAAWAQQGRDPLAVEADQGQQYPGQGTGGLAAGGLGTGSRGLSGQHRAWLQIELPGANR